MQTVKVRLPANQCAFIKLLNFVVHISFALEVAFSDDPADDTVDATGNASVLALSLFVTILAALSALADILVDVLILAIALVVTLAVATVAAAKLPMYLSESSSMPPTHWLVSLYFP